MRRSGAHTMALMKAHTIYHVDCEFVGGRRKRRVIKVLAQ